MGVRKRERQDDTLMPIVYLLRGAMKKDLKSATRKEASHLGRHITTVEGAYVRHHLRLCNFSASTNLTKKFDVVIIDLNNISYKQN